MSGIQDPGDPRFGDRRRDVGDGTGMHRLDGRPAAGLVIAALAGIALLAGLAAIVAWLLGAGGALRGAVVVAVLAATLAFAAVCRRTRGAR